MTFAVTTMAPLDQSTRGLHTDPGSESPDTHEANAPPRKRKRTRKVQLDRKFDCSFEGCGKSYSRAEHLYRHQLNRMLCTPPCSSQPTSMDTDPSPP